MNKKSPIEMERLRIIKTTRALIRLKYSLQADEELNDVLPDRLEDFDAGVSLGKLMGVDTKLLEDII